MAKINELFDLEKGTLQSSKCVSGDFDFITASREWKTHNEYTHDKEAIIFAAAASGSLGRTHYVNGKFITSDLCFVVTPKNEKKYPIDLSFYHIIFQILKDDIVKNTKAGTSKEAIGLKSLGNYDLPYIDIKKQKEISNSFKNNSEISDNLSHELTHQLSLISQLRQAFLREAMQGTLVSNETSDGKTGADLLAEIKAEKEQLIKDKKIKKGKQLPPISEGEIPFDIPENWVWCRLGNVIYYADNLDIQKYLPSDTIINYVDIEGIDNINFKIREVKQKMVQELSSRARRVLKKDYIVYSTVRPYLKNIAIIEEDMNNFIGSTGFVVFKTIEVTKEYIFSFLLNPILNREYEKAMVGFNSPSITNETFENTLIPLPPLEIQNRIVAKLDELMQYCDALEASVKESQNYNAQLLQQGLREALEGKEERKEEEVALVAEEKSHYQAAKIYTISDMAILAGHAINQLSTSNSKDLGRVKLLKMMHLVQYHCQLETPLHFQKKTAGPYTSDLENKIEIKLKQHRFFEIKKEKVKDFDKITYSPLAASSTLETIFPREFGDKANVINELLSKFRSKNTGFCERVSTMYAVWNNRLLKKETITNELLKADFLKWDEAKKKFENDLDETLDWMRRNGVVPVGFGEVIEYK